MGMKDKVEEKNQTLCRQMGAIKKKLQQSAVQNTALLAGRIENENALKKTINKTQNISYVFGGLSFLLILIIIILCYYVNKQILPLNGECNDKHNLLQNRYNEISQKLLD